MENVDGDACTRVADAGGVAAGGDGIVGAGEDDDGGEAGCASVGAVDADVVTGAVGVTSRAGAVHEVVVRDPEGGVTEEAAGGIVGGA